MSLRKQVEELQGANLTLEEEKDEILKTKQNILLEKETILQKYQQV